MSVLNKVIGTSIIIEVTRKCNMQCPHCLRGDAQNIDISLLSIDTFLGKLSGMCFKEILFTGGEPSLNTEAIAYTLECVKKYNIHIYRFSLVTNGKNITKDFVDICNKWIDHCNNRGLVSISVDKYHNLALTTEEVYNLGIKNVASLSIADYNLINLGRAKLNNLPTNVEYCSKSLFYGYNSTLVYIGRLVLTCSDSVLYHCDYEYEDEKRYLINDLEHFSIKNIFDRANKVGVLKSPDLVENFMFSENAWLEYLKSNNLI